MAEYASAAKSGAEFPPLLAFKITDRSFKKPALVAGFHRFDAFAKAGVAECDVEVREGTFAEAWLAGWLSNLTHGLRYKNEDKRKAVETALKLYRDDSAAVIADRIAVSDEYVRKVRKELVAAGQLEATEKVSGKDGVSQPAAKKQSDKEAIPLPTVGSGIKPKPDDSPESQPASATVEVAASEPEPAPPARRDPVLHTPSASPCPTSTFARSARNSSRPGNSKRSRR